MAAFIATAPFVFAIVFALSLWNYATYALWTTGIGVRSKLLSCFVADTALRTVAASAGHPYIRLTRYNRFLGIMLEHPDI
jgi:hypothetical protein